ncbi:Alpha/Beta hydrolase protein [Lipomyces kononenkoae]|uniref:Alpha/Beta hydrolase protein n=1 Tax=Lipomyces kononenkoae TaxID=34357 RepID=A0ACC3T6K2_LIPKO
MSDLQKTLLKSKLPKPSTSDLVLPEEKIEEATSEDSDRGTEEESPTPPSDVPPAEFAIPERPSRKQHQQHYKATPWKAYWRDTESLDLSTSSPCTFKVYYTMPTLSPSKSPTWFIFHHGAGSSGLTFSVLAARIHASLPEVGVLAYDARGHGATRCDEDHQTGTDASLDTLARDFLGIVAHAMRLSSGLPADSSSPTKPVEVVFIGHSLGGAVVTEAVRRFTEFWPPGNNLPKPIVSGLVVLDVVEGSALEGLGSMRSYLASRPQYFRSLEDGIRWHVKSHTVRNSVSASVSVPGIIQLGANGRYKWITDLLLTEPFWKSWFVDLSSKFLEARSGKMLVLAGTDRLDKKLTIGQMQGKYQLEVLPEVGHFIQEDAPEKLAALLEQFWHRNRRGAALEIKALNTHAALWASSSATPGRNL